MFKMLFNNRGCFGGGGSQPAPPPPPPPPAPLPSPVPTQIDSETALDDRLKRRKQLRSGLASTIKTGRSRGIFGTGANLSSGNVTGKTSLGA